MSACELTATIVSTHMIYVHTCVQSVSFCVLASVLSVARCTGHIILTKECSDLEETLRRTMLDRSGAIV